MIGGDEPDPTLLARRGWYAEVIADSALDVEATYSARFAPAGDPVGPGGFTPSSFATDRDLSAPKRGARPSLSWDRAGAYVRDGQGYVTRDPWKVARLMRTVPADWRQVVLSALSTKMTGRRRRDRHNVARALIFANIAPALGQRATARRLLAWEDELAADWRLDGIRDLVRRFEGGDTLTPDERRRLLRAESTMIRACQRARDAVPEFWRSLSGIGG